MPLNPHFNNFAYAGEQTLIEDLVIESIKIYGYDMVYCPRTLTNVDPIFSEDAQSTYNSHHAIEMYIKNVEGFEGEGDFLSKFNIQIRDEIIFTVAVRRFNEVLGAAVSLTRPREGDLLYFGLTKKVYVIKFVEHEPVFYQNGALQMFDIRCELFEYSNERLRTGFAAVDAIETDHSLSGEFHGGSVDVDGDIIIDPNTGRPVNFDEVSLANTDVTGQNSDFLLIREPSGLLELGGLGEAQITIGRIPLRHEVMNPLNEPDFDSD